LESRRLPRQRPGHCAECHSPRYILGGIIASQRFAGGPDRRRRLVPNITQKGLSMSHEELVKLLETGETRMATPSAARWPRS